MPDTKTPNRAPDEHSDKQHDTAVKHQRDDPSDAAPPQRQPNRDATPNQSKNDKF